MRILVPTYRIACLVLSFLIIYIYLYIYMSVYIFVCAYVRFSFIISKRIKKGGEALFPTDKYDFFFFWRIVIDI